jgi:hypothetical protein
MNEMGKVFNCAILIGSMLFASPQPNPRARQSTSAASPQAKFLDATVPEFQIDSQTVLDAVWQLARGPAPFSFGFEKVLKKSLADADMPEKRLVLHLKDKTVRQILEALCLADPRFTWSIDRSTINVFPKAIIGDSLYLLNRKLQKFELKNATDVQSGLLAIVRQLPPPDEQIAEAQVGGGDPYPAAPWTVTYHNLMVRQVLNRIALHGGPCGIWIFSGSTDFRALGFFNTNLKCFKPASDQPDDSLESSAKSSKP